MYVFVVYFVCIYAGGAWDRRTRTHKGSFLLSGVAVLLFCRFGSCGCVVFLPEHEPR